MPCLGTVIPCSGEDFQEKNFSFASLCSVVYEES